MIDLQHMHEGNEGMENLKQIEDLENKVSSSIKELREILRVYHYENQSYTILDKSCVIRLENLLGNLSK